MGNTKKSKKQTVKEVEEDDRFNAVAYDPRFQRFPREKSKIKVDDRFKDMFENPEFQVGSTKDKRGKKGNKKLVDEARRYYRLEEEEETAPVEKDDVSDDDAFRWARMRGLAGPSSSSSSEEGDSGEEDVDNLLEDGTLDEDIETLYQDWGVGAYAANPNENVPMLPDATKRLACVDLDWEHIKAVDILAVLRSFVPDGGKIVSVTVYPSDYGLQKMEEEKNSGPKQIWKSSDAGQGSENEESDEDGALDSTKLRYYERSKLRWYYAIVICSNVRTAEAIYNECDGMEYMKTANIFDLRFVPDNQSFKDRVVREAATEVPPDYVAPVFQTKALQHTNVELTWDKVDDERKKALSRKLKDDELKDEDFKTYLASASDSSDEDIDTVPNDDHEDIKKRYQSLLSNSSMVAERQGTKEWGVEEQSDDNRAVPAGCVPDKSMELEVTFEQDLETLGEKLSTKAKEKKKKGTETVWEAYVRRRKEKKEDARRKGRVNYHSSDDDESDMDSDIEEAPPVENQNSKNPFDDPFFTQNDTFKEQKQAKHPKGKSAQENGQDAGQQAELEMLLMDNESLKASARKHKSLLEVQTKKLSKKERMKLAKLKKRAEREDGSDNEDLDAAHRDYLNMEDPRFQDVFENPEFALDPTDPRFAKAGKGASKLVSEAARRRSTKKKKIHKTDPHILHEDTNGNETTHKADLKLMVASLKRKSASQKKSGGVHPKKASKW